MKTAYGYKFVRLHVQLVILRKLGVVYIAEVVAAAAAAVVPHAGGG